MTPDTIRAALRLYLVVDPDIAAGDPVEATAKALAGGLTMVQLRSKNRTDRETLAFGRAIHMVCHDRGVPFIVNDRLDLALALDADGVHLGVDDLPLEDARRLAGPDLVIGYSPETDDQLLAAASRGADYLGIGPFFSTATKADAGVALGTTEFVRRCALSPLPVVAIGGIGIVNAAKPVEAGADGIAVVSAILRAADPEAAARELVSAISR
ncbi:MAG: thiamine phosphate synthase [Thermomicrobiales bacterium]